MLIRTLIYCGMEIANEIQLRHSGLSYSEIAKSGGGIQKTVNFAVNLVLRGWTNLGLSVLSEPLVTALQPWNAKVGMGFH